MRIWSIYVLIFILNSLSIQSRCQHPEMLVQDGWELEKEKYEIAVFSKSISGYKTKAFKATGIINASFQAVYKAVMDIEGYAEWYPNCKVGEVLDQPSKSDQFRRIEFKLPWPFENKDAVNRLVSKHFGDSIWIEIINASEYKPKKPNVYRVGKTEGFWTIVKEGKDKTRLTYSAIGEPGGIPAWIVNIFLYNSPLEAINNLRKIALRPKYSE